MSDSISSILSSINYGTSWTPDQDLTLEIFTSVARSTLLGRGSSYLDSNSPIYSLMMKEKIIYWIWDTMPAEREVFLSRLMRDFGSQIYDYQSRKSAPLMLPPEKEASIKIFTDCFDAIPDDVESQTFQELRVHLSCMPINRSIDYAAKIMEANLSGNKTMVDFWVRVGVDYSKDPAVFSMAWSKIERSQGYTDRRSHLIRVAAKCQDYPETIIRDLIDAGHNKNRSALISVFTERISNAKKRMYAYCKDSNSLKEECEEEIRYCQSVLAKFVGCEDYGIMQQLIPNLRREDLIFAAPTAAKLGLQRLLDKHMNGVDSQSRHY